MPVTLKNPVLWTWSDASAIVGRWTSTRLTASCSCSASLSLHPGSSKEEISITAISAQSSLAFVLAGRFHGGRGAGLETAEGILSNLRRAQVAKKDSGVDLLAIESHNYREGWSVGEI